MSDDTKTCLLILALAAGLLAMGFILGYMHVIVHSEAYLIDGGRCVMLEIDGNAYRYEYVSSLDRSINH